jgi:FPC/CPF motif-containing protein YcgG
MTTRSETRGNYCAVEHGRLFRPGEPNPPSPMTCFVHDSLRAVLANEQFTCAGAKAAVAQDAYRFGLYGDLASPQSSDALAADLARFVKEEASIDSAFTTYIASFTGPASTSEPEFERLLWQTLQQLHDLDDAPWDAGVSADPGDPNFSFSFANEAFYIVGFHAGSSRVTRRFAWPTLVFNPHRQFQQLKAEGRYSRFQQVVRDAERRLQGDVNPMLADHGDRSEAAQYSGRRVDAEWKCPFSHHPHAKETTEQEASQREVKER